MPNFNQLTIYNIQLVTSLQLTIQKHFLSYVTNTPVIIAGGKIITSVSSIDLVPPHMQENSKRRISTDSLISIEKYR